MHFSDRSNQDANSKLSSVKGGEMASLIAAVIYCEVARLSLSAEISLEPLLVGKQARFSPFRSQRLQTHVCNVPLHAPLDTLV